MGRGVAAARVDLAHRAHELGGDRALADRRELRERRSTLLVRRTVARDERGEDRFDARQLRKLGVVRMRDQEGGRARIVGDVEDSFGERLPPVRLCLLYTS